MGSHPGARLQYGIDLRDEYGDMPEGIDVDDLETVAKSVDERLSLKFTGNLYYDVRYILASHVVDVYAYDAVTVTPETLVVGEGHQEILRTAFRAMFPDREVPEPQWLLTVHYG